MKVLRQLVFKIPAVLAFVSVVTSCNGMLGNKYKSCPMISVPLETAFFTHFKNNTKRDVNSMLYVGEIVDVESDCRFEIHKKTDEGVMYISVSLRMRAERGAIEKIPEMYFPYFVALVDSNRNILNKKTFSLRARFKDNVSRMNIEDTPVGLTVPIKRGQSGPHYHIYLGFQIDEKQRENNRRRVEILR